MKLQGSIICISRRNRLFILIFETDVIRVKMKSIIVFLDECGVRHVQPDTKLPINAGGGLGYPMVLSLCVCVCVRACMCVCLYIHRTGFICLKQLECHVVNECHDVLKTVFPPSSPSSLL